MCRELVRRVTEISYRSLASLQISPPVCTDIRTYCTCDSCRSTDFLETHVRSTPTRVQHGLCLQVDIQSARPDQTQCHQPSICTVSRLCNGDQKSSSGSSGTIRRARRASAFLRTRAGWPTSCNCDTRSAKQGCYL